MKIAVVGLGLMGGSLAKAITAKTHHQVLGLDRDGAVIAQALACGAIAAEITPSQLGEADACFVCLFPQATIDFCQEHKGDFRPGAVVADICGVKEAVVAAVAPPLQAAGVCYIGTHPMAGRECSGFGASCGELFSGASWIVTPTAATAPGAITLIRELAQALGFAKVVTATPQQHDRIIAYTSQLAHIASSAYIKSAALGEEAGFSAGSFQDMTRVAKLDAVLWTDLFAANRQNILTELDSYLAHLQEYRDALAGEADDQLRELLAAGCRCKEQSRH